MTTPEELRRELARHEIDKLLAEEVGLVEVIMEVDDDGFRPAIVAEAQARLINVRARKKWWADRTP